MRLHTPKSNQIVFISVFMIQKMKRKIKKL